MISVQSKFILFVALAFAITRGSGQTTGPSQPEVQSFQPASVSNMVDLPTGQFQYSIPLFTIGGYPVNINYNSLVGMENEASFVGLGFNLNCGTITRQIRGLPDDFMGDPVIKKMNMRPNITMGLDLGLAFELAGFDKEKAKSLGLNISSKAGLFYNNYNGFGIENSAGLGFHGNAGGLSGNAGLGINSNSQHGTSVTPYFGLGFSLKQADDKNKEAFKKGNKKYDVKPLKIKGFEGPDGASGSFNFNATSYTPKIDFPFKTLSLDFSVKVGYAGTYFEVGADARGYIVKQQLDKHQMSNPAYGFLYADNGQNVATALMDFNRDNDGVMTEEKPNLPFAYATPDVYAVAGQGIGGEFEIKRNNVFIGFDAKASSNSQSGGLEVEAGFGTGVHVGADLRYGYILNTSEKWNVGSNKLLENIDFINPATNGTSASEKTYFKDPSDVMFNRNPVFSFSAFKPVAPTIKHIPVYGGQTDTNHVLVGAGVNTISPATFTNQNRDNRSNVIYYLTAQDASAYGLEKTIENYTLNNFSPGSITQLPRVDDKRQPHHLSEITCLKTDGSKYVFNIPAYNNTKTEVAYSVNSNDVSDYETSYLPDVNAVSNTGKGRDDLISVTQTPAYAHSFLLGAVLSANYIDVDDNGPTPNDLGDYVKFNYARVYENYYWRSNNDVNKAVAELGNLADDKDERASYTEGTKEIWNIHSIETKTEVCRFYYSDNSNKRTDAYDLKNTSQTLMRLDSILIFSRPELQNANPMPFRRIYFDYNTPTPLCKGIYNAPNKAKLTLNAIYFKDGSSNKGKYSAYKFGYSAVNPNYDTKSVDRWGNYKPNNASPLALDNKYFPFALQDSAMAAQNASAWLLNKIQLPSGGVINVAYEANDYAYVQNKKAMYMAPVAAVTNSLSNFLQPSNNVLYNNAGSNNYVVFKLKKTISATTGQAGADDLVKQQYFTDNTDNAYGHIINGNYANLYGKFRVVLSPAYGYGGEDIPVFLNVKKCGALKSGSTDFDYGYIELFNTTMGDNSNAPANQISKTAWDFIKHNYPSVLFGMDADPALSSQEDFNLIVNMLSPAASVVKTILQTGPYKKLKDIDAAKSVTLDKSYIRLYVPDGIKYGGNGARVKSITINDDWQAMSSSPSSSYTIHYKYRKTANGKEISSGVASYEPENGGEENPWKQPVFFKEKNFLMPDDNNFVMTPYGESLFPSANIVYSEVTTIKDPVTSPHQIGTGYTKNEYYTYYDFPCSVAQTKIDIDRKPKFSISILKNLSNDYMVSTQGYVVVVNDMQGKPKSEAVYGESGNVVSATYYKYKTVNNQLSNTVKSINAQGVVNPANTLGVETQLYGDARRFHTESYTGDVHGNLEFQMVGPVPTIVPSVWPDFAFEKKTYSSFTLNKFIRQQGILDSVIVVDKGSVVYTSNKLWDEKTGAVILTGTINEFKDPVYNFTYPAHWAYSGMGMASDNIMARGLTTDPDFKSRLQPGDIIGANNKKYVVETKSPLVLRPLYKNTPPFSVASNQAVFVLSSGKKNLAATGIGSFSSLRNPVNNNSLTQDADFYLLKVIDAGAIEYANTSLEKCDSCSSRLPGNMQDKYLLTSLKYLAPWQQLAAYKFVDDRTQSLTPVLRSDGAITNFSPFWLRGTWGRTSRPEWQFTSRVNMVDNKFNIVETVNPLQVFSSVQQSNFDGMINASTNNARYLENLFDGFEDVRPSCSSNHFSVINDQNYLDSTTAHTGYYSMKTGSSGYSKTYVYYPQNEKYNCAPSLTLLPNKKYILSAWVKEKNAENTVLDYTNTNIKINFTNTGTTIICKPAGQIIDGWQRVEQQFSSPLSIDQFTLQFSANANFDDVRIFPADGNMKSFVYSYKDYSLMAVLDENNFAMLYEYDQQKQLKRVKKETEKGIVTVKEINFGSYKQ